MLRALAAIRRRGAERPAAAGRRRRRRTTTSAPTPRRTASPIWSRSPAGSTTTPSIAPSVEADVCLCLRWPTNREASGPWLRALAAGKPTVVNDLAHLVDLPTLDPRTWTVQVASPRRRRRHPRLAPRRGDRRRHRHPGRGPLAGARDAPPGARRRRCAPTSARAARRHWAAGHTVAHMADDYERAIAGRRGRPGRVPARPPAARTSPPTARAQARRLAAEVGVAVDFLRSAR